MGIFSWGKYTKVLVGAEKDFIQIYNHSLAEEDKTFDTAAAIAQGVFYERAMKKGFTNDDVEAAIKGLVKSSHIHRFLIKTGDKDIDAITHSLIYPYYVAERVLESNTMTALISASIKYGEKVSVMFDGSESSVSEIGEKSVNDIVIAAKIQAANFVGSLKYFDNWSLGYVGGTSMTIVRGVLKLDPVDWDEFTGSLAIMYSKIYEVSNDDAMDYLEKSLKLVEHNEQYKDGMNQGNSDMAKFMNVGETPKGWKNHLKG